MKYLKTLGLLAIVAAALVAFAGTASATFTSPTGIPYTGEIAGTSTNNHFTGTVKIACKDSSLKGSAVNGSTTIATTLLSFTECSPDTVTVLKTGHLYLAEGAGGVKSTGTETTLLTHKTVFGFPLTSHCIYATNNTSIGTITDSHVTGGHAFIDINANIPRGITDAACGEDPIIWTGTYTITKPTRLYVD